MISKLPEWVWTGAWLLSFVAGMVNVVGLLSFQHQAVTHLTGSTSQLAMAMVSLDTWSILHLLALIGSFIAGTVLSGFLIGDSTLELGRQYGMALLAESVLLLAAVPSLNNGSLSGIYLACCASGLQNAMVSTYSGALIRTSHLTGLFTDLGIFLGQALRQLPVDKRRVRLCLLIISAFLSGGVAGTLTFTYLGNATLLIPAALTSLAAITYGSYRLNKERAQKQYA